MLVHYFPGERYCSLAFCMRYVHRLAVTSAYSEIFQPIDFRSQCSGRLPQTLPRVIPMRPVIRPCQIFLTNRFHGPIAMEYRIRRFVYCPVEIAEGKADDAG